MAPKDDYDYVPWALPPPVYALFIFMLGTPLVVASELLDFEGRLAALLPSDGHKMSLLCLGVFGVLVATRVLTGIVLAARCSEQVPYPFLYASKHDKIGKDVDRFNRAQRAHQNTLESLAEVFVAAVLVATVVDRPRYAGAALLAMSLLRVLYAYAYVRSTKARNPWFFPFAAIWFSLGVYLFLFALRNLTPVKGVAGFVFP